MMIKGKNQSHAICPAVTWTTCDLDNSMIFCLFCKLPMVLQFNVWVSKRQQHSPTWSSLPASRLFFSTDCFQAGRLSVERPQTAPKYVHVIQQVKAEAQVTSKRIVLVVFWGRSTTLSCESRSIIFGLPKITPWVSGAFVCISGASSTPWPQKNWIQMKLPTTCVGAIGLDQS